MSESRTFDCDLPNDSVNTQFEGNPCGDEDTHDTLESVSCSNEEEMIDITWPCHSEMNWDDSEGLQNIEERFFNTEETSSKQMTTLSSVKSSDISFDNERETPGCSNHVDKSEHSAEYDEECEELKQFNREDCRTADEIKTLVGVNELIRKFSKIELLRQKENLRKSNETKEDVSPSCSSSILQGASPKPWDYEDFMDDEKFTVPDPRCGYDNPNVKLEESDSDSESEKFKEVELIKKLVKHAIAKEKQEKEKRDDVLTSSKMQGGAEEEVFIDPFDREDDITEIASGDDVTQCAGSDDNDKETFPFLLNTNEGDYSSDFNKIFDGYEIDSQESFHDWMIDVVLSRDLESCDMDGRSNAFL